MVVIISKFFCFLCITIGKREVSQINNFIGGIFHANFHIFWRKGLIYKPVELVKPEMRSVRKIEL